MRVLHVAQPTTAGVARVVVDLAADQVRRGWETHLACPDGGTLAAEAEMAGARRHRWTASRGPGAGVGAETTRLAALVRHLAPDIVHLHSSKAGLAGRLAIHGTRPTVFQPHAWSFLAASGLMGRTTLAWERAAMRWTDVLAVVSEQERRSGEAVGIRGRYALVPNGVDVGRRVRAAGRPQDEVRAELGLGQGDWVVCPGRLCQQKGQDLLLRAWPRVVAAAPGARLVLVGDGPDRDALAATADASVMFAGAAADLDPWLVAADVVVLPSRWEGASLVVLEAMAIGRSIVASQADGMSEALDGTAGAVVDAADSAQLARAIVRRITDRSLREREAAAGRRRVAAEFDVATATARVAALYEELGRR